MTLAAIAVAAGAERRVVREYFSTLVVQNSPYEEWLVCDLAQAGGSVDQPVIFFQGG